MGEEITIGLAFIAGLISFVSPCVLPLVPAYIGYMGGRMTQTVSLQTAGGTKAKNAEASSALRFHLLIHSIAFVLGFTVVFVAIGLMTTAFASVLGASVAVMTDIIGRVGGLLIIFFGLHFMGVLPNIFNWIRQRESLINNVLTTVAVAIILSLLIWWAFIVPAIAIPVIVALILGLFLGGAFSNPGQFWTNFMDRLDILLYADTRPDMQPTGRGGLSSSAMMGVVFSAGWTPCIGPTLGVVLTLAANTGDVGLAIPLLTAYSLGLGIPFIITAVLINSAQGFLMRLNRHMNTIKLVSGTLLVIIGITVASGQLQALSSRLVTGEFADLTFRIEECSFGAIEGRVHLNQLGSCLGGTLHPVAINQIASGELDSDTQFLEYVFPVEAETAIDVTISRPSDNFTPEVTLFNPANEEIAISNDILNDEDDLVPLANVTLEQAGNYRLVVENAQADTLSENDAFSTFRVRVREAQELAANEAVVDILESGTLGNTEAAGEVGEVNSITDVAETTGPAVGVGVGNLAPDFTVISDTGEEVSLSDFRGEVVFLNFWGTWCGPCRREMPEFQDAFEARHEEGFNIFAIAVRDTVEAVRDFREEFGLTFTLAMDDNTAALFGVQTQPSTYVIDAEGVIVGKHFGILLESQIDDFLEQTLGS